MKREKYLEKFNNLNLERKIQNLKDKIQETGFAGFELK